MTKNYIIFTEQPWVIGDLKKTLIGHVLQVVTTVQHEYDDDVDDNEKEKYTYEDLVTTGQIFGANHVLGH